MKSIFIEKGIKPTEENLKTALGDTYKLWTELVVFIQKENPASFEEWKYSGEKQGWSFRICDKKRVIIYFLPRDKYFKAAFVFGQKATEKILDSSISENIKNEVKSAKVYAEGRGIRIDIKEKSIINDIKTLIRIKIDK